MQSKLAGLVRREFEASLRGSLPQFKRIAGIGSRNSRYYAWPAPGVTFYLVLEFHNHWEAFTVSVAWSTKPDFPWAADMFESPFSWSGDEKRFWLVALWDQRRAKDYWWELAPIPSLYDVDALLGSPQVETLIPRIGPAVGDVMTRIREYAIPYFGDVQRALAGDLPVHFRSDARQ